MARCLAYVPVGWSATNIRPAASSQSDLRVGGVVAYAAGGVWAGLCLYLLLPGVEAGHLGPGSATGEADPLGGGVGLRALALECMSVSRVAAALGVAWYAATSRGPDLGRAGPQ